MPTQLIEGIDYTVENGCWVFTAKFLRDRGYCCGNGCRNCPYEGKGGNADDAGCEANGRCKPAGG